MDPICKVNLHIDYRYQCLDTPCYFPQMKKCVQTLSCHGICGSRKIRQLNLFFPVYKSDLHLNKKVQFGSAKVNQAHVNRNTAFRKKAASNSIHHFLTDSLQDDLILKLLSTVCLIVKPLRSCSLTTDHPSAVATVLF